MQLPPREFKATAFDFDGTLADTIPVHTRARIEAFPAHDIDGVTAEQHELAHRLGNSPPTIIGGLLKSLKRISPDADVFTDPLVQAIVATKKELYLEYARQGLPEIPGSIDFYRAMSRLVGVQYNGVVSSAYDQEIYPFRARYGLESVMLPNLIVSADTLEDLGLAPKPAGDCYVEFARRVGMRPDEVLAIEDSTGGVKSAKIAGCLVLAMGTTNPREVFMDVDPEFRPTMFVDSFADFVIS